MRSERLRLARTAVTLVGELELLEQPVRAHAVLQLLDVVAQVIVLRRERFEHQLHVRVLQTDACAAPQASA